MQIGETTTEKQACYSLSPMPHRATWGSPRADQQAEEARYQQVKAFMWKGQTSHSGGLGLVGCSASLSFRALGISGLGYKCLLGEAKGGVAVTNLAEGKLF